MTSHHQGMAGALPMRAARLGIALLALLVVAAMPARAGAATVTPVFIDGNPKCVDLDPAFKSVKEDSPSNGTTALTDGYLHVELTVSQGKLVGWQADHPVDAVIVKGGPNANVYAYDDATSDSGLHPPLNQNGKDWYGLSHVDVCYKVTPGKVVVSKQTDPGGDPQEFPFHPSSALGSDFTLSDDGTAEYEVQPGTYTVSEGDTPGWALDGIDCSTGATSDGSTATYTVHEGQTVTCTFHNVKLGKVRVLKTTTPAGDPAKFRFDPSENLSAAQFALGDGDPAQEYTVMPGSYGVTEEATTGWRLDTITCDDADSTHVAATATYNVAAGEIVTCTFANSKVTSDNPPPPGGDPTTTSPGGPPAQQVSGVNAQGTAPGTVVVEGTKATSARARIRGPRKCVSGRYSVTVSGSPIAKVTFYLNGKKLRSIKARKGQRTFTVAVDARVAGAHAQRITAKVTFAPGATKRTKTLAATALRCSPGALAPQFTG